MYREFTETTVRKNEDVIFPGHFLNMDLSITTIESIKLSTF